MYQCMPASVLLLCFAMHDLSEYSTVSYDVPIDTFGPVDTLVSYNVPIGMFEPIDTSVPYDVHYSDSLVPP